MLIAHAGHWLVNAAYLTPVVGFLGWLGWVTWKERREEQPGLRPPPLSSPHASGRSCSWLERRPVTPEVAGSSPVARASRLQSVG